jgi:hypothetical protein
MIWWLRSASSAPTQRSVSSRLSVANRLDPPASSGAAAAASTRVRSSRARHSRTAVLHVYTLDLGALVAGSRYRGDDRHGAAEEGPHGDERVHGEAHGVTAVRLSAPGMSAMRKVASSPRRCAVSRSRWAPGRPAGQVLGDVEYRKLFDILEERNGLTVAEFVAESGQVRRLRRLQLDPP